MSKKKEEKIDLLDDLLAIEGDEPVELLIGGHELHIRRAHTGAQIVEWQAIELSRVEANTPILSNDGLSEHEKIEQLADNGLKYLSDMLNFMCVAPTAPEDIQAVCDLLSSSTNQVFNTVAARIFFESGLFDEDGNHVPFQLSSSTKASTAD
ncbi:hypothetical protein [Corynebacterium glutamicum]|uniref:hypothetical protein n=1 Tax=Corynebacterium glutamicum TaxID=1718 RepID=UPI000943BA41|nr:hypothetical protein [Corynebacterium glutamicum]OKX85133.1 hypothetical protein AUO95_00950 [Corynebacterium glutamicum]